jgi:glycosyltransferase involved in cell wall biosynthesis
MGWRILHLDSGRDWRGGQRQVLLLALAQRAAGEEPLLVVPPRSPLLERAQARGLASAPLGLRGEWDLAAARRLRALVSAWRPDIVHAHDARAHSLAILALLGGGPPLVVSRRVAAKPRGRLKYGRRVAHFIAISGAVRSALVAAGVPETRISVVYDGVPQPRVEQPRDWRLELDWPQESVIAGVVGAMTAEKGIQFLGAIAEALPAAAQARTRLVLLGGSGSGYQRLGPLMAWRAGFVEDIHPAMAGLDVLWHPATSEGLGTAVIDAMALGVPPVAFAVGGLPELVQHQETGFLVPARDTRAFAARAAQLALDPELRRQLAKAAIARAAEFSVERMAQGTRQVYSRVLRATWPPRQHRG